MTLVEVLIALVILLFVSLALMQTALLSIDANMKNVLRDEAITLAEQKMTELRSMPFASMASVTQVYNTPAGSNTDLRKSFRLFTVDYAVAITVTDRAVDLKEGRVLVTWTWKGENYSHEITSVLRL